MPSGAGVSFDDVETSAVSAKPVELIEFDCYPTSYLVTTNESDVTYSARVYSAVASSRDSIQIVDLLTDQVSLGIEMPASHPLVQQYVNGVPPQSLRVTVTRYYPAFGVALVFWPTSYVSSLSFSGRTATFRVPSQTNDSFSIDCPSVCATKLCNNVLYDAQCAVAKASFKVATTITSISTDGKTIVLAATVPHPTLGYPNGSAWSLHGELLHVASGATRTIIGEATDHKTLTIFTQFPNGLVTVGDSVDVYAGCDHTIATCDVKFSNGVNHGGHPYLPIGNIFYQGLTHVSYTENE